METGKLFEGLEPQGFNKKSSTKAAKPKYNIWEDKEIVEFGLKHDYSAEQIAEVINKKAKDENITVYKKIEDENGNKTFGETTDVATPRAVKMLVSKYFKDGKAVSQEEYEKIRNKQITAMQAGREQNQAASKK